MPSPSEQLDGQLRVTELHKHYPTPTEPLQVLRGASLAMQPGDSLAILGPSGSGKSTLLNILGTLEPPTSGQVRLGEIDPFALRGAALARFRSRQVGLVFQDHHLLPQCTALENVLLARLASGRVSAEDQQRGRDLLERVGLAPRAEHLPGELSGGERQRVAVARAVMNAPALLLCDEPTGNLDARSAQTVGELLVSLAGQTRAMLIVVTHSTALAALLARRQQLQDGVLVDEQ